MRELRLRQTGGQFDEFLAHIPVPDGNDQACLSSHLRLRLSKVKQKKPNKCYRWLGAQKLDWSDCQQPQHYCYISTKCMPKKGVLTTKE